jgi:hypothetical protein
MQDLRLTTTQGIVRPTYGTGNAKLKGKTMQPSIRLELVA